MTYKNYLIYKENGELKITDHIGTVVIGNDLIEIFKKYIGEAKDEQKN